MNNFHFTSGAKDPLAGLSAERFYAATRSHSLDEMCQFPTPIHVSVAAAYRSEAPRILTPSGALPMRGDLAIALWVRHQVRNESTAGGASC